MSSPNHDATHINTFDYSTLLPSLVENVKLIPVPFPFPSREQIHLPSLTSFANWPTSSTPLGHVTAVDFSAQSEYLAVGNTRGRVLLYHLKEYGVGS